MKNLTKTALAVSLLITVACKEKSTLTPAPPIKTTTIKETTVKDTTATTNGTNGTNGTTVLYSDWISPGTTTQGNGGGGGGGTSNPTNPTPGGVIQTVRYFNVAAPAITQEILNKGVVLAYCRLKGDGTNTRALATTTMISGFISIWDFALTTGRIQFIQTSANPFGIPAISSENKFRYVIIPPTKHLRLSKPLKEMSYTEICILYGIPE